MSQKNIVYSGSKFNVKCTMVNGKILYEDGHFHVGFEIEALYDEVQKKGREVNAMNIQIFGKNKCFDTKKAQRYFKERNIKFQFINLDEKEMSKKEFESVLRQVGIDSMIDPKAKDKELLTMLNYLSNKEDKVYLNQHILKTPIVRNKQIGDSRLRTKCLENMGLVFV